MMPTDCEAEFPMAETTVTENCSLPSADTVPDCPVANGSGEHLTNADEDFRRLVAHVRKNHLNMLLHIILSLPRNHILRKRLNWLLLAHSTRKSQVSSHSTLNDLKNQQRRSQVSSHSENSSSTKKVNSASSPLPDDDRFAVGITLEKIKGWQRQRSVNKKF